MQGQGQEQGQGQGQDRGRERFMHTSDSEEEERGSEGRGGLVIYPILVVLTDPPWKCCWSWVFLSR